MSISGFEGILELEALKKELCEEFDARETKNPRTSEAQAWEKLRRMLQLWKETSRIADRN